MISCSLPYASVQSTATGNFLADANKTIADLNALLACIEELAAANASASGITGSGTTHFLPVWTGATSLGNSHFEDHATGLSVDLQNNIGSGIGGLGGFDGLNVFGAGLGNSSGFTNLPPSGATVTTGWAALFTFNGTGAGLGTAFYSTYYDEGTPATPGAVGTGTIIRVDAAYGQDGSGYVSGYLAKSTASENWSAGHHGTDFDLETYANGVASATARLQIHGDGSASLRPPSGGSQIGFAIAATISGVNAQGGVTLEATNVVHVHQFLLLDNVAVSGLPSVPVLGNVAVVNNALAPAVGSAVVAGGTAKALVWWNGAQWTVMGI